jgi:hypothetical protein
MAGSPVSRSGGQRGSKDPQGKQLSGEAQLEYQIEAQSAGKTRLQLEVAVVTVYGTDNTRELRQFVAANAAYICYGLRNGPVYNHRHHLLRGSLGHILILRLEDEHACWTRMRTIYKSPASL